MLIGASRLSLIGVNPFETEPPRDIYGFRAITPDSTGHIWVAAANNLGYFQTDACGICRFVSLQSTLAASSNEKPGAMLEVQPIADGACFLNENAIWAWQHGRFERWPLPSRGRLQPIRPAANILWAYAPGTGLYRIGATRPQRLVAENELPGPLVWVLPPEDRAATGSPLDDGWLAGTAKGAWLRMGGTWRMLPEISAALARTVAVTATALDGGRLAIGTQNAGVLVADRAGHLLDRYDQENSLEDNQVYALWVDPAKCLWVGTSVSWSRITPSARISRFLTANGKPIGAPRDITRAGALLFVATNRGVFQLELRHVPGEVARLLPLSPAPAPVELLASVGGWLYSAGAGHIWRWSGQTNGMTSVALPGLDHWARWFERPGDILCLEPTRTRKGGLYFTLDRSLWRIEAEGAGGAAHLLVEDVGDQPSALGDDGMGRLWVATANEGLRRYELRGDNEAAERAVLTGSFHPGTELPADFRRPAFTMMGDRLLVQAQGTILAYDPTADRFGPVPALEGYTVRAVAKNYPRPSGTVVVQRKTGEASFFLPPALARLAVDEHGRWNLAPLAVQSIYGAGIPSLIFDPAGEGKNPVWIGGNNGLVRFAGDSLAAPPLPPAIRLFQVTATLEGPKAQKSDGTVDAAPSLHVPLAGANASLPSTLTNLLLRYGAEGFANNTLRFQSKLAGLDSEWLSWGDARAYSGLAPGDYEFRARAIDSFGRTGPEEVFAFSRAAPWYRRWPAWVAYILLGSGVVATGVRWRLRRLQCQNQQLNRLVDERTRELQLANSAKSDFLTSISHEIRNPLNGITGLVGMLSQARLDPKERELAESLAACARSLRRVFDEVLGFARLEEGHVILQQQDFRLRPILEEIARVFAAEAAQRHCPLTVQVDGDDRGFTGDAEKIRTIIGNFVSNALKYAPGASISVEALIDPAEAGSSRLTVQVRDQGPGIAPQEQELIFRKFVRGSTASARQEPGAGLGLAACQALARLMGGGVGVESRSGQGATFYLTLTLPHAAKPVVETGTTPLALEHPEAGSAVRSALVVEDHAYNLLIARNILERLGYQVQTATEGQQARQRMQAGPFDLVVLDWEVAGTKGDELARFYRAQPQGDAGIILAVTAHDSEPIRRLCLAAGMDGFLVKPLEETLLAETIRAVRGQRQAGESLGEPDFQVFHYLGRGDEAATRAAAREYAQQLESGLAAITRAGAQRDAAALATFAHQLRGQAAVVRFRPLKEATRQLHEAATGEPDWNTIGPAVTAVEAQAGLLRRRLEAFQAGTPAPA